MRFRKKSAVIMWLLFSMLPCLFAKSPAGKVMYISSENIEVKVNPRAFAKSNGGLVYGEPVRVLDEQGKWIQVQSESTAVTGWIPATAVTSKRIRNTSASANASAKELALAGKGFTQEIEDSYKKTNAELDYGAVDKMENRTANSAALESFIKDGKLSAGE